METASPAPASTAHAVAARLARRLRLAAAVVALAGIVVAAFVYLRLAPSAHAGDGYQIIGGQSFVVEESAAQRSQTERLGGKALLFTAGLDDWFASLWQGQRLAWTLLGLSATVSLLCLFAAGLVLETPDLPPPDR